MLLPCAATVSFGDEAPSRVEVAVSFSEEEGSAAVGDVGCEGADGVVGEAAFNRSS